MAMGPERNLRKAPTTLTAEEGEPGSESDSATDWTRPRRLAEDFRVRTD